MISFDKRIAAFEYLGRLLSSVGGVEPQREFPDTAVKDGYDRLNKLCGELVQYNTWFDERNVRRMMLALGESLKRDKLLHWTGAYQPRILKTETQKTIGVIMAGNIPAVGFHDFLSVLVSGHKLLAKVSRDDHKLMPAIADLLISIEPAFAGQLNFTESTLKSFDAIIATGSNNTSRYFDYYFSSYPHIIRRNRNGVAVLTGEETERDLQGLANDIFQFYGLGCRNVSKIFVPAEYDFNTLLKILENRSGILENHKYFNNYEYNKAILLINSTAHFDTGNLLLVENASVASPVSVLHYEFYKSFEELKVVLQIEKDGIQCVVSGAKITGNDVPFGKSQQPELWDYADGVDTLEFLLGL